MSKVKLFHNFTSENFTWKWDGKDYTFKAGEKRYLSADLAEHFAKHLTNRELAKKQNYQAMSPKEPKQVEAFWEIFSKACIDENPTAPELDDTQVEQEIIQKETYVPDGEPKVVVPKDFDKDEEGINSEFPAEGKK